MSSQKSVTQCNHVNIKKPVKFVSNLHINWPHQKNWTRPGHDVIFVCCSGYWDAHDIEWQKGLEVKGTRWCGHWTALRTRIQDNTVYGLRTLLITYSQMGPPEACIDPVPKHYRFWYAAKWLVFGHFETCLHSPHSFSGQQMKLCLCVVSTNFQKSGMMIADTGANRSGISVQPATDYLLGYDQGDSAPHSFGSFSGKPVKIACRALPAVSKIFTACDGYLGKLMQQLLARFNATLVIRVFSARDSVPVYLAEEIDIIMLLHVSSGIQLFIDFDLPIVSHFGAITFYVKASGTIPVNVRYVLEESKLSMYLLLLCLALCFATLVATDLIDSTVSGITLANDTLLFLVATFYSTSCDLPASARCVTSRRLIVLSWVLGSFSLSVYFKGQLTSWLVARIPEPIVDDLIKLEKALDANAIRACITRDTPRKLAADDSVNTGVMRKVDRCLSLQPEQSTLLNCFKCASHKEWLCFTVRQVPCFMRTVTPRVTESKDPLVVTYAGVPVRKHYPLKKAFRSLVQRVHETDLYHMTTIDCQVTQPKEEVQPTSESLNMLSVAQFLLPCFGVSFAVFLLEVLFGRYFAQRAERFTGVHVA